MRNKLFFQKGKAGKSLGWIFAVLLLGLMPGEFSLGEETGDVEKGKGLYQGSCQHCHGIAGKGDGEMADYLTPRPANLASQTTQAKSDQELKNTILNGRPGTAMAGFEGAFEENDLHDLLAYLRSLKP